MLVFDGVLFHNALATFKADPIKYAKACICIQNLRLYTNESIWSQNRSQLPVSIQYSRLKYT